MTNLCFCRSHSFASFSRKHVQYKKVIYLSDKSCMTLQGIKKIEPLLLLFKIEKARIFKIWQSQGNNMTTKNRITTKLYFNMTKSYLAIRKSYPISCILHGLTLVNSGVMKYEKFWKDSKEPSQLNGFLGFLSSTTSGLQCPNVWKLLQISTATSWNASCIERGYPFLQMVSASRHKPRISGYCFCCQFWHCQ